MAEERLVMYVKPTCTTCRQVMAILREQGVDFDAIDYFIDPVGLPKLRELVSKLGIPVRERVRTKESSYRELGLDRPGRTEEEILRALAAHPELLQRPILERGDRAAGASGGAGTGNFFVVQSRVKKKLDAYPSSITLATICRAVPAAEGPHPTRLRHGAS